MTAKLVRCKQGHVFDLNQTNACPSCGEVIGTTSDCSDKEAIPPQPGPERKGDILKRLMSFPLNAAAGAGVIAIACLAWYFTSAHRVSLHNACSNPTTTADEKKSCPALQATSPDLKSADAPKLAMASSEQQTPAAASAPANVAVAPSVQAPPVEAQMPSPPIASATPSQPPQTANLAAPQQPSTTAKTPAAPSSDEAELDPLAGMRLFSDKSPATRPTHRVVLEQAATDFAIGMKGRTGVVAALVCEDPSADRFGSGAITVWMDVTGGNTGAVDGQPAPTIKVDGVEIALDLLLRIDGKEFNLKNLRVLTLKKGHRLVGDVEATETLFAAMATAKRVEIVGDNSVLMVETGGRFDELEKVVEGCKRIAGRTVATLVPNTTPARVPITAPQSYAAAPDPAIAALEDKYAFTPLARELLATSQGAYAYDRKDYQAAAAWLASDDVKDNPAANFYRAQMAETGHGALQDYATALRFFAESANAGFYWAQLRLGKIYRNGEFPGVPADPQKAKPWLIMAAKEDRGEANRMLSEMGVPKEEIKPTRTDLELALGRSYQEVLAIANTLVSQGSGSAYYWAGDFLHDGKGIEKNPAAGRELLIKGARTYDAPSIIEVAQWSFDGEATPKNGTEAVVLGYIARENTVFGADEKMVDKRISQFLERLNDEQYEDARQMLKGIRDIPSRLSSR